MPHTILVFSLPVVLSNYWLALRQTLHSITEQARFRGTMHENIYNEKLVGYHFDWTEWPVITKALKLSKYIFC